MSPTIRQARWGLLTDDELSLLANALLCIPHPRKYLDDMYGEGLAAELALQIGGELTKRGYLNFGADPTKG